MGIGKMPSLSALLMDSERVRSPTNELDGTHNVTELLYITLSMKRLFIPRYGGIVY
jgi:hypothetical protein